MLNSHSRSRNSDINATNISSIYENSKIVTESDQDEQLLSGLIEEYYPGEVTKIQGQIDQSNNIQQSKNQHTLVQAVTKPIITEQTSKINNSRDVSQLSGFVVNIKKPREHSRSLQSLPLLKNLINSKSQKNIISNSLNLPSLTTKKQQDEFLSDRFLTKNKTISVEMKRIQGRCEKFGGYEFLKREMNRQTVDLEEARKFYKERIRSIHGSLSLPKIEKVRGIKNQDLLDIKLRNSSPSNVLKQSKWKYNKWYMKPQQRFSKNLVKNGTQASKYIEQMLAHPNRNTQTIKLELGSNLAKQVIDKLHLKEEQQQSIRH